MGLFFSKNKTEIESKYDKDKRIATEFGCDVCQRNGLRIKSPFMKPTGVDKPTIYILGESPGENEDYEEKQFIGDAGNILRVSLNAAFQDFDWTTIVRFNNAVRCYNNNETPDSHTINCCRKSIIDDIIATKPIAIFGFGNTPLESLLNESMITMWRGRRIAIQLEDFITWYFPMFHPSFLLRKKQGTFYSNEFDDVFERDIRSAIKFIFDDYEAPQIISSGYEDGIDCYLEQNQDLFNALDDLKKYEYLGIDIETQNLRPNSDNGKIVSISIGNDEHVVAFPLFFNVNDRQEKLIAKVKELLLGGPQFIAHNLKFELEWFYNLFGTQDILRNVRWHDTMAQAYVLDERTSQNVGMLNLDRLIRLNFGFNLKELSTINKEEITKNDLKSLLIYNGMDSKYTYKLFMLQKKLLDKRLEMCYNNLIETAKTLTLTQSVGLTLDIKEIDKFDIQYSTRLAELEKIILNDDDVKKFLVTHDEFNPLSGDHLKTLFKDIMKLPELKKTLIKQKFSVDDDVLTRYYEEFNIEIAKDIIEYRNVNKNHTMYVTNLREIMYNGKLYPNFNLYFTQTGRLSSGKESN